MVRNNMENDNTIQYNTLYHNEMKKDNEEECLHDQCIECLGTGRRKDGTICIHMISCPCPKCNPRC